jgi:preprotein translocase subunit SecE
MVANKLEVETNKNRNDLVKWILAGIIFSGSILAFYYLDQYPLIYRILGIVGATLIDFAIVFNTEKIKSLRVFTHDARVELKKVIWSTKAEVIQTTVIVFVVVIIMSVLLWLLDKLLGAGIKFLLA